MLLKVNTNPSKREVRWFGVTLLIAFGIIGGVLYFRGRVVPATWVWSVSLPIALLAMTLPRAARLFYVGWMGLAFVMGSIMSRVIMTLLFFIVVTPVAFFFRLIGRDGLGLRRKPEGQSYWSPHRQHMDRTYYDRLS